MEDKLLGATATPTAVGPDDTADPGQSLFDAAGADFGLALLGQLLQQQPGSSIVVSPFSVACVLAFVHAGARGCTAEQLAGLLAGSAQGRRH
jgi:serine protease inhibitor